MLYGFYGQYTGLQTEISLQILNTVVSFVCVSFEPVRWPTHCPDDRAL